MESSPVSEPVRFLDLHGGRLSFRVSWSAEDAAYVATCAQMPSLSNLADDREEALAGLLQYVSEFLRGHG